jgi:FkbM family methyltransferase
LDLGANCGVVALRFGDVVGSAGRVVALEPDPINFEALQKNLEYHHAGNVQALCAGVWSHTGELVFNSDGSMGATAVSKVRRGRAIRIPVISLLDLVARYELPRVDFVKMDIEGAEFEVILSSGEFLEKFEAAWVVEVHDRERIGLLSAVFTDKGYSVEVVYQSESHGHPLLVAYPKAGRGS